MRKTRTTRKVKANKKPSSGTWFLVTLLAVVILFGYLTMNLKTVDYGYEMQELRQQQRRLKEDINRLKAQKASLMNLDQVEKRVIDDLGYRYPESHQFIKVYED